MENNKNFDLESNEVLVDSSTNSLRPSKGKPVFSGKKFRLLLAGVLAAVVLVAIGAVTSAVYLLPVNDPFVRKVTTVLPYPIAVVNAEPISFKEFFVEWDAMQSYLSSSQVDTTTLPSAAEMRESIIEAMVQRTAVKQLAKQYGIIIDQSKVDEMVQSVFSQYQSEQEALDAIDKTFGWDKQIFIDRVVKPLVLSSQLGEAVAADGALQTEAKAKIDGAWQRLNNGEDFATVAKEVSEDSSASSGGEIGFVTADMVPPEWIASFTTLGLNKFSEVVDLSTVYSITMVSEQKESEDDGTQFYFHLIIVNKQSLDDVLQSFVGASKVWKFFSSTI